MARALMSYVRLLARRLTGPVGPVPTPEQLDQSALRHAAGTGMIVLSAAIVGRTGNADQQWQYLVIAAALLPQVLLAVLAAADRHRRAQLRTSKRPALIPLSLSVVLAGSGIAMLLLGQSTSTALAAFVAAGGLAIAAAPVTVTFAPRPGTGAPST